MRSLSVFAFLLLVSNAVADVEPRVQRAWRAKCAACHGDDGKGQTESGKKLGISDVTTASWQQRITDAQIRSAITKGIKEKRNGKDTEMPAFADLKPELIDGLTKLLRSLAK